MRKFLLVPLLGALAIFASPTAWADSYTDVMAGQLSPSNRVVVDTNANPKLPNPSAINDQINQANVPIWVVNVAKDQTGSISPDSIKDALYAAHNPITNSVQVGDNPNHNPPLIIEVIDAKGYHARAFDVSQQVADAVDPNIKSASAHHRGDLNGAVSDFVSTMAAVPNTGPPAASSQPTTPGPSDNTGWWVFMWVVLAIIFIGVLIWLSSLANYSLKERRRRNEATNDKINSVEADVNDLADAVLQGVDVSTYQTKAALALSSAQAARKKGKWAEAASQVGIAQRYVDDAYGKVKPDKDAIKATPGRQRKAATVAAVDASGTARAIDNTNYKRTKTNHYRNYYAGGETNGVYFYPGWYPYPFWTYTWNDSDVMMGNTVLHDQWRGDYDSAPVSTGWATSAPSYSDFGGSSRYSGSSSGSGSAGFSSPAPSHHHSSSSSSSGSSYSGGSSSSSSGGSSDFGGGGGSFGGDSSGGGSAGF